MASQKDRFHSPRNKWRSGWLIDHRGDLEIGHHSGAVFSVFRHDIVPDLSWQMNDHRVRSENGKRQKTPQQTFLGVVYILHYILIYNQQMIFIKTIIYIIKTQNVIEQRKY